LEGHAPGPHGVCPFFPPTFFPFAPKLLLFLTLVAFASDAGWLALRTGYLSLSVPCPPVLSLFVLLVVFFLKHGGTRGRFWRLWEGVCRSPPFLFLQAPLLPLLPLMRCSPCLIFSFCVRRAVPHLPERLRWCRFYFAVFKHFFLVF